MGGALARGWSPGPWVEPWPVGGALAYGWSPGPWVEWPGSNWSLLQVLLANKMQIHCIILCFVVLFILVMTIEQHDWSG